MKNLVKLLFVTLMILSAGNLFAQYATTVTPFPFVNGPTQDVAPQCVGGLVYDDGTWENGYGWNPGYGTGKWVTQITPTSYPYTINQVCFAMTRLSSGSANWTFDIEVWTSTTGGPGTLVTSLTNQVATGVGIWPTVTWHDFTGITTIPPLTSGSYYVGVSYDPVTMPSHYVGADESSTTPLHPGYGYIQNAWGTIQSYFATYRAMGIRVDGTGQQYAHNVGAGPFLSLPGSFSAGTQFAIKAKISNLGTSNETGIPVKYFVNGAQLNSTTLNLNAGAVDSVSFNWTPADSGNYTLKIVAALATDEYRANDTVTTTVHVWPAGTQQGCYGTGSVAVGWPFYTFYMDSRTDMLYTAAELGISAGSILRIGYNVIASAPQVMNGFTVKMQNTTNTTISGFTSSGWTDVYTGTYSVPGTGWQWINLQNPFTYTGTNLLVEICFHNTSYTSNSTVASTTGSGMTYHYHMDNGTGCTISGTNSATSKPNICMLSIVGNENQGGVVPSVFSLSQNYPNPFNPSTVISYSIPKTSMVNITVFDIVGREVGSLVNNLQQPGSYNVQFDASNLASGVYFYKIQAGDFTDTKKMLLVK